MWKALVERYFELSGASDPMSVKSERGMYALEYWSSSEREQVTAVCRDEGLYF